MKAEKFFYGAYKYRKLIEELPEEKLFNPDGSFNRNCVTYEEFCRDWVTGTFYEQEEFSSSVPSMYRNTIKRLHLRYSYLVGEIK